MLVTRFAPSPTGYLHLGHAFAAKFAQAAAEGGRFLLRIEDLDVTRCRETFVEAIFEDLHWLGLSWEAPVLRQSTRMRVYRSMLDQLDRLGLIYPCFCTRKEIAAEVARSAEAPHGPDGALYPGSCRRLSARERLARENAGATCAWRLDSAKAAGAVGALAFDEAGEALSGGFARVGVDPVLFGDVVLARKDVPASYHLAVVVDDAVQGVTLVTRGRDLLPSTHVQRVLQTLLELPPPRYAHHRLVLDSDRRKVSKRDGAMAIRDYRARGVTPVNIAAMLQRA